MTQTKHSRASYGLHRYNLTIMLLVAVGVAGYLLHGVFTKLGTESGSRSAELSRQRLQLVWPDVMEWPMEQRAFVVGLSMTCRLSERDATREDTIACLESAAADPAALLPKGLPHEQATPLLARMLAQAPPGR